MSVRAKFKVSGITEYGTSGKAVALMPVYDSNPESENGKFFNATPWGKIELGTVNPAAAEHFEIGKEFYVDFTPAP